MDEGGEFVRGRNNHNSFFASPSLAPSLPWCMYTARLVALYVTDVQERLASRESANLATLDESIQNAQVLEVHARTAPRDESALAFAKYAVERLQASRTAKVEELEKQRREKGGKKTIDVVDVPIETPFVTTAELVALYAGDLRKRLATLESADPESFAQTAEIAWNLRSSARTLGDAAALQFAEEAREKLRAELGARLRAAGVVDVVATPRPSGGWWPW